MIRSFRTHTFCCQAVLLCDAPPTSCVPPWSGGVPGSIRLTSVIQLVTVRFAGYRTQQCEECSSIAKKHQETRHWDLFQRRHL